VEASGLRKFDTFHSRRLFTELFLGATFTNDYNTEGESTGFNETSPLARVTFDTLWYRQPRGEDPVDPVTGKARRCATCRALFHTGVDMEFSSFPFGPEAADGDDGNGDDNEMQQEPGEEPEPPDPPENAPKNLQNAFSGALFAVWFPDRWSSYSATSDLKDFPTDAIRLGPFVKFGMTTRTQTTENGDSSFHRMQVGLRFTHHQTKVGAARLEQDNIVPIRFVELSIARFEEYAGEKEANRLVLDAGFRLPGLGSNMIPFYAGIHLNAGRGPDDLRVFAGFLFKINEIATLFQGVRPE
jgi:hypothetical protein